MIEVLAFFDTMSESIQNKLETIYNDEDLIHLYTDFDEEGTYNYNHILEEIFYIICNSDNPLHFITNIPQLHEFILRFYERGFEKITIDGTLEDAKPFIFDAKLQAHFQSCYYEDGVKKKLVNVLLGLNNQEYSFLYLFSLNLNRVDWDQKQFSKKDYVIFGSICELLLYHNEINHFELYSPNYKLLLKSISLYFQPAAKRTNSYLEDVLSNHEMTADNKYYVWNQFKYNSLRKLCKRDDKTSSYLNQLYQEAYDSYYNTYQPLLSPIAISEREPDTVIVFTIQLAGERHAPSKTTLERCRTLLNLGKKVILVNTTEQYTDIGRIINYSNIVGTIIDDYYNKDFWKIDNTEIPFIQLKANSTTEDRIKIILSLLHKYKPYYILSIGTGSMLADLMSNVIPCFSMALAFSTLPHSVNTYQILGRNMTDEEKQTSDTKNILESRFTFELTPQKIHVTRAQYGLPQDAFLIAIIGIRLDFEIDDELLSILDSVCQKGCHVVFAGNFDTFSEKTKSYQNLSKHSSFIGYCNDILALMEICDLYVNPNRLGGGFSVIEAFEKSKPGVYLKTGDVYTSGGPDFAVDTYADMEAMILKYKNDHIFYQCMSKKAKERAKLMTFSIDAMRDLDNKIMKIVKDRGI